MYNKILIADDHFLVRLGTAVVLESYYNNIEIDFAESHCDINKILGLKEIDLLILDIGMPGVDKAIIKKIKMKCPRIKILLFSAFQDSIILEYMLEGADGYLNKQCNRTQITDAVRELYSGEHFFSPEIAYNILKQSTIINPKNILSEREYEIFGLLADGLGNLEITNKLGIQPGTVSTYKKRIFKKMQVKSIADLIKIQLLLQRKIMNT